MKEALETVRSEDPALQRFCRAVKQNLDQMMGHTRKARHMEPLPENPTMSQVVARLNEIAERLQ